MYTKDDDELNSLLVFRVIPEAEISTSQPPLHKDLITD